MKNVQAGLLRQRVTIESATETPNSFNEPVRTWSPVATLVPVAIDAPRGDLRFIAQQFAGIVFHQITMRFLQGVTVTPPTRFRLADGRVFLVQFVRNVEERNRVLEILAKEVVGEVPA